MHIDEDIETLERVLRYEEDSKIWKDVIPQWKINKMLRDKFGPPKRNQTKILSSIKTFEHQTERIKAYNMGLLLGIPFYVAKYIALLGIVVLLV